MADTNHPTNYGEPWTREELILAFDLYCRIPFNKTKANNAEVIELAILLERSPASVARKLGNFGSFDIELKKQNVTGLIHVSKMDEVTVHPPPCGRKIFSKKLLISNITTKVLFLMPSNTLWYACRNTADLL